MALDLDLSGHNDASQARQRYLDSFEYDNSSRHSIKIDLEMTAVPVLLGICFLIGIITNGALFYTICKAKKFRNVPNSFLLNIALANIVMLVICPPMIATSYVLGKQWPFGSVGCKMVYAIPQAALAVSMFSLVALSIERYVAFVAPPRHRMSAKNQACCGNLIIWILGVPCGLPLAIFSYEETNYESDGEKTSMCKVFNQAVWPLLFPKIHTITSISFLFLIPILVCTIFYLSLSCVICGKKQRENRTAYDDSTLLKNGNRSNRSGTLTKTTSSNTKTNTIRTLDSRTSAPTTPKKLVRRRKTMAKVALFLMIQFTILWTPRWAHTLRWYFSYEKENMVWYLVDLVGVGCIYLNAALTPFTAVAFNRSFKRQLGKYFCCCFSCIHCCFCWEKKEKKELPPGSSSDISEKPPQSKKCSSMCCLRPDSDQSDSESEESKDVVDNPAYSPNMYQAFPNVYQELPGQGYYDSFTLPTQRPEYTANSVYATPNKSHSLRPASERYSYAYSNPAPHRSSYPVNGEIPLYTGASSYHGDDHISPYARPSSYQNGHTYYRAPHTDRYISDPLLNAQAPKYSKVFMPNRAPRIGQATSIKEIPAM